MAGWLAELDRDVFLWVVDHRAAPLDPLFVALSAAGHAGLLWIALALVLALLTRRPPLRVTLITAAVVWTADVIAVLLKEAAARDRPYTAVPDPEPLLRWDVSSSLPSGHAATSAAGAVILVHLLGRGAWALAALAAAVGYSRIYIGVHYPLDVLAGAAIGVLVALGAIAFLRSRRRTSGGPPRSEGGTPGG